MTSEIEVKVIRYSPPPPLPDRFFWGGGVGVYLACQEFCPPAPTALKNDATCLNCGTQSFCKKKRYCGYFVTF